MPMSVLPGSALGIPPTLLGPTGNVYIHGDGQAFSTHLNFITDHPSGEGSAIIPLLVPGQVDVEQLLADPKSATPRQFAIARRWAATQAANLPRFDSPADAEREEQRLHQEFAPKVRALVAPFLGPFLPTQNQPPATTYKP